MDVTKRNIIIPLLYQLIFPERNMLFIAAMHQKDLDRLSLLRSDRIVQ